MIFFYLNMLTILLPIKAIEMTFENKCHYTCCGKKAAGDSPVGRLKEKGTVNPNFNNVAFLIFNPNCRLKNCIFASSSKIIFYYENVSFSGYRELAWQPPE